MEERFFNRISQEEQDRAAKFMKELASDPANDKAARDEANDRFLEKEQEEKYTKSLARRLRDKANTCKR